MSLLTGLVAYYKLDGNSNDSVGTNNGTDTAITYSTANGKIGQGAGFNGTSSLISLGNVLSIFGAITISAWVYKTSTVVGSIVARGNGTNGIFDQYMLDGDGTNFRFYLYNGSTFLIATSPEIRNAWTHVVGVWSGGATPLQIYINGVKGTDSASFTGTQPTGTGVNIGKDNAGATQYFGGDIDEVAIYNRALSASEVLQLFNAGLGNQYPFNTGASFFLNML